jgi:hypothetical protein
MFAHANKSKTLIGSSFPVEFARKCSTISVLNYQRKKQLIGVFAKNVVRNIEILSLFIYFLLLNYFKESSSQLLTFSLAYLISY